MNTNRSFTIWLVSAIAGAGMVLLMPSVAFASNASKEAATAAEHAGYAAAAKNIKGVHKHLHHALNCLVGPKGSAFDSKFMDPCKGMGNGALPDASNKTERQIFLAAAHKAERGLKVNKLSVAKEDASEAQAMLKRASKKNHSM